MEIPILGPVTRDDALGWYESGPIPVPILSGKQCRIAVIGYDDDQNKDEFHTAIANFLSIDPSVLKAVETHIYEYYQDTATSNPFMDESVVINEPADVWQHVFIKDQPLVSRRAYGDQGIYISLECNCDWEEEHGLEIVFKNGLNVNKVGQYDGHATNSDAYGNDRFEDVIYVNSKQIWTIP